MQQGLGPGDLQWKSLRNPACHWLDLGNINLWPRFCSASQSKIGTGWIIYEMIFKQKHWVGLLWFTGITLFMIFCSDMKHEHVFRRPVIVPRFAVGLFHLPLLDCQQKSWLKLKRKTHAVKEKLLNQKAYISLTEICATISISYSRRCSYTLILGPVEKYQKRSLVLLIH